MTKEEYRALPRKQQLALYSVYRRTLISTLQLCGVCESIEQEELSFPKFLSNVRHTIGCDGAVCTPFAGMFLLVEKDGYTHS